MAKKLWLVVVRSRAYSTLKLEYNIVSADNADDALTMCVDAEHAPHLATELNTQVVDEVFGGVACCISAD